MDEATMQYENAGAGFQGAGSGPVPTGWLTSRC
jgi:hypothetical protein